MSDAPVIQPQAYTPPGAGGPGPRRLPARRLWVWAVIGSALLVFALAMLFLFTARAVTLEGQGGDGGIGRFRRDQGYPRHGRGRPDRPV